MARKKAREEDKRQASLMEETASEAEDDVSVKHNGDHFLDLKMYVKAPVLLHRKGRRQKSGTFGWCPTQSGLPPELWSKYHFF